MKGEFFRNDSLNLPSKEVFIKKLKETSDSDLSHLFTLSEEEISNVLTAVSFYCEHQGCKAKPEIYEKNLLQMVQYEEGDCGHRFLLWSL